MNISKSLGLSDEIFCRMVVQTKMLLSNVLGHAAELHYEKKLKHEKIGFSKAPTDQHYDYVVRDRRKQVKRFESDSTDESFVGVNLTQTHGNRQGPDAFYKNDSFDDLILFDVGFNNYIEVPIDKTPKHPKYTNRLISRFKVRNVKKNANIDFDTDLLKALKVKNTLFPESIEALRQKYNLGYILFLEKICKLTLEEIDSLFSEENFRLVTGAKGFAAEEHFNLFLDKQGIKYRQIKEMYSKIDHIVNDKIRVQVKIPNLRSTNKRYWGFKTHKSHGHGKGELYKINEFDILALFVGFKMDTLKSKYFPVQIKEEFIFIPDENLPRHPDFKDCLKRVSRISIDGYKINDLSVLLRK